MFDWWRKRKERKRLFLELNERYPGRTSDPYKAVMMKASQKLAAHLGRFQLKKRPEETLRQFFFRVSMMKGIDREALFRSVGSFEEALYSHHDVGDEGKKECIDHLRKVEASLDHYKGGMVVPKHVSNEPIVLPPSIGPNAFPRDIYPEQEMFRHSRPGDLRRLISRFESPGTDRFPELDASIANEIRGLIKKEDFRKLKDTLMETAGEFLTCVKISTFTGLYILEISYRIKETLGLDDPEMDGLIGLLVPGCMALAGAEGRDYIIPDDVKISLLTFLPGYDMRTMEDARKIVDCVWVPSTFYGDVEMDIIFES